MCIISENNLFILFMQNEKTTEDQCSKTPSSKAAQIKTSEIEAINTQSDKSELVGRVKEHENNDVILLKEIKNKAFDTPKNNGLENFEVIKNDDEKENRSLPANLKIQRSIDF